MFTAEYAEYTEKLPTDLEDGAKPKQKSRNQKAGIEQEFTEETEGVALIPKRWPEWQPPT